MERKRGTCKVYTTLDEPQVGDEVVTSGLDGIFFGGVRVGVVKKVIKEELSKTAIIEQYSKVSVPSYYHIIEKN